MSATNRGTERRERDYYPTPHWCTRRFFEAIGHYWGDVEHWIEPCAGAGDIQAASGIPRDRWTLGDIEPQREDIERAGYAETIGKLARGSYFLQAIVTNPPFAIADEIVRSVAGSWRCAFLLRLSWLGGGKRSEWLRNCPPDAVFVLPNRPSFTGDGRTDAADYGWFIWDHTWDAEGVHILPSTPAEERRNG